jgi:hypothetical protein
MTSGLGSPKNAITHNTTPSAKNQTSSLSQNPECAAACRKQVKNVTVEIHAGPSRKIATTVLSQTTGIVLGSRAGLPVARNSERRVLRVLVPRLLLIQHRFPRDYRGRNRLESSAEFGIPRLYRARQGRLITNVNGRKQ